MSNDDKGKVMDIRPQVQAEVSKVPPPASGDPRDYTADQLKMIIQQGTEAVQALLTAHAENGLRIHEASSQLGSMRMLLAIKMDQEAADEPA